MKRLASIPKRKQIGNVLIYITISLGVISIIQLGLAKYMVSEARQASGRAAGLHLASLRDSLEKYNSTYETQLKAGTAIPGVVNPYAPTIAELTALGLSDYTGSSTPFIGGQYMTQVITSSAVPCGIGCTVKGRIWLRDPIRPVGSTTKIDINVLGAAVNAASADGNGGLGYSLPATPTLIRSEAGWTETNPDATNRAGILMAVTGSGMTVDLTPYLKRDGTQPVTADFPMTGLDGTSHSITGANNITAAGTITGNIVAGTTQVRAGNLQLTSVATEGGACASNDLVSRTSTGSLVTCQGGVWTGLSAIPAGTVLASASSSCPSGSLVANGGSYARTSYPALYARIGTLYGGTATTFNVPNYMGVFLRGWGSQASGHYGSVTHSSGSLGALQGDAIRNITAQWGNHPQAYGEVSPSGATYKFSGSYGDNNNGGESGAGYRFDASRVVPTANEIRPINRAVRYCIQY